jgi:hypothetical protein
MTTSFAIFNVTFKCYELQDSSTKINRLTFLYAILIKTSVFYYKIKPAIQAQYYIYL